MPQNRAPAPSASAIDWNNLRFNIIPTNSHIRYTWKNGQWDDGVVETDPYITLSIAATVLHYGQSCFEGLKAFRMKDGKVRVFRPELNAERLIDSCQTASMPAPSVELFLDAVRKAVEANIEFVPPYGSMGSMYIRPFVFGSGPQIGLHAAEEYTFMIFVNPVGDFYKGGVGNPVTALIQHSLDRAAPYGSGHLKLGGNYAPILKPTEEAHKRGYTVNLFLDAAEHKYVEEFATSNFAALTPVVNGTRTYVTPKSRSILNSVTNRSLEELAHAVFGWTTQRRAVEWTEVENGAFNEVAACGTAVILTPVKEIHREIVDEATGKVDTQIVTMSPEGQKFEGFRGLYQAYRALQYGELEGWEKFGWMWPAQGLEDLA
ncbi:aminotransferase [Polychytrium aggregatum]|uniref:aminotransferase n=1 Tax=Polychytrium aggregatum TaxID=110093 RepID=UPI0022FDBE12|nr:aminotransferase [Polychytrium aggregatum]KAI9209925.1 aminotransferase [Polychytrium aggregatum]